MNPNLDALYVVLRTWAVAKHNQVRTYMQLSEDYKARTGDWFEPEEPAAGDAAAPPASRGG
ncbi:hypothetical protein BE11_26280 [Sorangium cellulosum]|nr:hypothetical protein BE11_26280 [Sorangium cellulosum]